MALLRGTLAAGNGRVAATLDCPAQERPQSWRRLPVGLREFEQAGVERIGSRRHVVAGGLGTGQQRVVERADEDAGVLQVERQPPSE